MINKKCKFCEEYRCVSLFTLRSDKLHLPDESKSKYSSYCKECQSIRTKIKFFNLTKEEYFELLESSGMKCGICNIPESEARNNRTKHLGLYIDHCHATGKVRGLLCHNCNLIIGHAKDNIEVLKSAIHYLSL